MAKKVDHEQRKREIAETAIRLFSQVGYDNVSLIMIAAATGISRTALYRYFCSKREVMDAAIVAITDGIGRRCRKILFSRATSTEKLRDICHTVVEEMFKDKEFLVAVFDFVVGMVRHGAEMDGNIGRFTAGAHKAIRLLVRHAIATGEIRQNLEVERISDVIYSQFESCAMRIVVGTEHNAKAAKVRFSDIVSAISTRK